MKATGIVRRIDELGRVAIPQEIRRTLRIREGDALEIYTDRDGGVILRKYSMIGELAAFAAEYCDTLRQSVGHTALICDKDAVVACRSVSRRDQAPPSPIAPERPISDELEAAISARRTVNLSVENGDALLPLTRGDEKSGYTAELIVPIIASGDAVGAVILLSKEQGTVFDQTEVKVAETAAAFLGRQTAN